MMHAFVVMLVVAVSLTGVFGQQQVTQASDAGVNRYVVAFGTAVASTKYAAILSDGFLIKSDIATTDTQARRTEGIVDYQVQPGDTLSSIAARFKITIKTIQWGNQVQDVNKLKPGQTITILPVTGILYQVKGSEQLIDLANKYGVSVNDIATANDLILPSKLVQSQELVVPLADSRIPDMPKPTPPPVVAKVSSPTSSAGVGRAVLSTAGVGEVVGSGQFVWPTTGIITKNYAQHIRTDGWRDGAIDIASNRLPVVVASDAGVVVFSGWDTTGYGNRVDINHGNGYVTRYAHLSAIYVGSGDHVDKGQVVGKMGCTGHCTGPHTHFMIILNGVPQDPLRYLP